MHEEQSRWSPANFLTFLFPCDDLCRNLQRHQAFLSFFPSTPNTHNDNRTYSDDQTSINLELMQRRLDLHKSRIDATTIGLAQTTNWCSDDQACDDLHHHHRWRRPNGFCDEEQKKKERKKERIAVKTKWVLWLRRKKKRRLRPSKERKKNWRQRWLEKGEKKERKVEKEAALETIKSNASRVLLWQWVAPCVFNYKNAIENWVLETEIGVFNFHNSSLKN